MSSSHDIIWFGELYTRYLGRDVASNGARNGAMSFVESARFQCIWTIWMKKQGSVR